MSDLRVLVIDDMRVAREPGAVHATNPSDGISQLYLGHPWDIVALDHDLGFDYETGKELDIWPCMQYIEANPDDFRDTVFYIVTSNPVGGDRMKVLLDRLGLKNERWTHRQVTEMFTYRSWEDMTGY